MKISFNFKNSNRGQSIVEALIAISIIIVGVVGIARALSNSLSLNKVVSNQYIAVYLASEGIEIMRNMMDDNFKDKAPALWDDSLDKCVITDPFSACGVSNANKGCAVNYNDVEISSPDANSAGGKNNPVNRNPLVFINPNYVVNTGAPGMAGRASFSRVICVRRITGDLNILEVESLVRWTDRGDQNYKYSLVDRFYNVPTKLP